MNIFELHENPIECARMHCDKHIVKMPIEYAQLLSTAHRVLDGEEYVGETKTGRRAKRFRLNDEREKHLYMASHIKHPDGIWVRECSGNYYKLFFLYMSVLAEFTLVNAFASCDKGAKVLPPKITAAIKAPIVTTPSEIKKTP